MLLRNVITEHYYHIFKRKVENALKVVKSGINIILNGIHHVLLNMKHLLFNMRMDGSVCKPKYPILRFVF